MSRDTIVLGSLAALNLVAVTVSAIVSHSVPEVLATSLTALVGATAGVAYSERKQSSNGE